MIYIIWGLPGEGKSYYATHLAIKLLKNNKKVYTNFPIRYFKKQGVIRRLLNKLLKKENKTIEYNSFVWEDNFIYEDLVDSTIIIDEGYRNFSSRESWNFSKDMHTFFATNRHNNLDIYVIAQNPARLDRIIREMSNIFYNVTKWINPITGNPLWFSVQGYSDISDMGIEKIRGNKNLRISHERIFFKKDISQAYDTHFYRKESILRNDKKWNEIDVQEWMRVKKEEQKQEIQSKEEIKKKGGKKKDDFDDWKNHPLFK